MNRVISPVAIGVLTALLVLVLFVVGKRVFSGSSSSLHPGDHRTLPAAFRNGAAARH